MFSLDVSCFECTSNWTCVIGTYEILKFENMDEDKC
jgi:hypothetical protein